MREKRNSKRTDAGLVFFGRRYYSPSLGRWLTPDPLGYTDGINRYSYVRNNPLNRFDEYGLYSFSEGAEDTMNCMQDAAAGVVYGVTDAGVGVYSLLSTTGSVLIDTARFKNPITSWNYYSNQSFGWVGQTYDWMDQNIRRQEDDGIVFTISRGASRLVADTYGAGKLTRCVSPAKSLPVVPKRTVIATPQLRVAPPPVPSQTIYSHPVQSPWIQPNRLLSSMDKMYRGPSNKGIRVKQIWTSTKKRTSVQNAFEHWKDHGNEFPELLNSKQYVEQAHNFFTGRGQLSTKIRPNGEILIYDAEANIFGTFTGEGVPKTMFKPTDGMLYWERN